MLFKEKITGELPWKLENYGSLSSYCRGKCVQVSAFVTLAALNLERQCCGEWEISLNFLLGIVRIWTYVRFRIMTLDSDFRYLFNSIVIFNITVIVIIVNNFMLLLLLLLLLQLIILSLLLLLFLLCFLLLLFLLVLLLFLLFWLLLLLLLLVLL